MPLNWTEYRLVGFRDQSETCPVRVVWAVCRSVRLLIASLKQHLRKLTGKVVHVTHTSSPDVADKPRRRGARTSARSLGVVAIAATLMASGAGLAGAQPTNTAPSAPAVIEQQQLPARPSPNQPVTPSDPALSSKKAEPDPDWKPTANPKSTLVPGHMRSDREEIPAPFTKADADKAETMEAEQVQRQSARGITALNAPVCQVYWPSPYQVCDAIRDKYNALGGPASFLSFPYSGNITNPDGVGQRVTFLNGPIYWSPQGGAHPVVNSFLNRWGIHGYEAGWLKYPTTDEILLPDGGRHQEFEFGAIYVAFQNAVGSAIKNGDIRTKWNTIGGTAPGGSLLGYPIQDEVSLPDGQGRMARFERGVIYGHPTHGAHHVMGRVLNAWADAGYETGILGYPIADEVSTNNGATLEQDFYGGKVTAPGPQTVLLSEHMPYITPEEVLVDAQAVAAADNVPLGDLISLSLADVADNINSNGPRNDADAVQLPIPQNVGDIFYSDAAQDIEVAQYEHGHNGIFVTAGTSDTVQALNPTRGVQLVVGVTSIGVHNPQLMSVNTTSTRRNAAALYAKGKDGSDYNNNFAFNRRDWEDGVAATYNCSQLVWAAYMNASDGQIDLDADGGWGVWPKDVRESSWVTHY